MTAARKPRPVTAPFRAIELITMLPLARGYDWGDTLGPLAGDEVVTPDGQVGVALHTCPGRPPLPRGGQHRYVHLVDGEVALAWHITQLRPLAVATEIN